MYAVYSSLETETPIMLLNMGIGPDKDNPNASYIDGSSFQAELFELNRPDYKSIQVNINSPGGNVVDGYNICNALLHTSIPVDTYCVGIAASMAAVAFMCGRKRIMADYSSLMIHNPFGGDDKKMLKALQDSLVKLVCAKSKLSEDEVAKMMNKETWLSAKEALECGFATEIRNTSEENVKRMPRTATASIRALWQEADNINNNSNKNLYMAEVKTFEGRAIGLGVVANYLGLNIEASESSILDALRAKISTEITARTKAEEMLDALGKALAKKEKEFNDMKAEYDAKTVEYGNEKAAIAATAATATAAAKAAQDIANKAAATSEIQKYVDAGRVKSEQLGFYVDAAIRDGVDKVKAVLGDLPINVANPDASRIETKDGKVADPNKEGMSAIHLMAKVKAGQNARLAALKA